MSFYEYNLQYQMQWPESHYINQYSFTTEAPFTDYAEPCGAATVPTISQGPQHFQDYYYNQYSPPVSDNYQEKYQYVNETYNQYCNQNQLSNTNYQPLHRKENYANVFKKVTSNLKGIIKPKRHRTVFKIEQTEALEMFYKHKQFVTQKERQQLQEILNLSDKTIKVWFQNRRLKDKKESKHNERTTIDEYNEVTYFSQTISRIDDVDTNVIQEIDRRTEELQQSHKQDELDDFLLNVITNPNEDKRPAEVITVETQQVYYEPISPAESCDEKDISELQTFDPKELLKTFLNFQ